MYQKNEKINQDFDSEQQLNELLDLYGQRIQRLIYTYVKDKYIAEDLTQEVFIKVFQNLHLFRKESSLYTWIYRIAVNRAKDYLRTAWVRRTTSLLKSMVKDNYISTENTYLKKAENKQLIDTILRLQIEYREVILLFYIEELTINEMSEILNIKETTIRTRLRRGREKLKKLLQREETF
ncbi:hypothetical protein A8F94_15850 [Bacillus sp. FJAT-27225]|uniref:sigma-70 family RNA polymerase sigma factor n=1 Tax=Bacillus sp. FJAT-27225 TaxID=1743144 RepID=UPI00080C27C7|nr:sigma-70 family RNA polymerase sigma factor [Bacillus sp. FJAT-27225]OCA84191.1 hypothetical protein A8F94_15850 [Bacillus sp. FJAT-27225]